MVLDLISRETLQLGVNISSTMALSFSWGNCLKMLSALVRRLMFSGLGKNGTKDTRCKPNLLRLCSL